MAPAAGGESRIAKSRSFILGAASARRPLGTAELSCPQKRSAGMRCPECAGNLVEFKTRGINLDRCDSCGALWFDRAELQAFLTKHPGWKSDRALSDRDLQHAVRGSERKCPRCQQFALTLGDYRGTGFRKCAACGGVLLDKKNLNHLLSGKAASGSSTDSDVGGFLLEGLTDVDVLGVVLEFVFEVIGGALSA